MKFQTVNSTIRVSLPITTPTGKVRVKRPIPGQASEPVACRSVPLAADDHLEWQISYDTDSLNEPSVLRHVILNKPQGVRYGCELVCLLAQAKAIGILDAAAYAALEQTVFAPLAQGIEETEQIQREPDPAARTLATRHGFSRHHLRIPNYLKTTDSYGVEIKIAHKQRAVGNQAMIYVNLPLHRCASQSSLPLIGRPAQALEQVDYVIDAAPVSPITDTLTTFVLASARHHADLQAIFRLP